jgi:F-box domain
MRKGERDVESECTDLPIELIHVVSQKLPELGDYIRFRAVCKKWRLSAPLSDLPPELPCIIKLDEGIFGDAPRPKEELCYLSRPRYRSLATGKTGGYCVRKRKKAISLHILCYFIL